MWISYDQVNRIILRGYLRHKEEDNDYTVGQVISVNFTNAGLCFFFFFILVNLKSMIVEQSRSAPGLGKSFNIDTALRFLE